MRPFKIKVYLGEACSRVFKTNPANPRGALTPFQSKKTTWTFVTSTAICRSVSAESGGILFTDCEYTDGSSWPLSEIDYCIDQSEVVIKGPYQVFDQEYMRSPEYTKSHTKKIPLTIDAATTQRLYPLAAIYHHVVIGKSEFRYDEATKCLVRDYERPFLRKVPARQQVDHLFNELHLPVNEICRRLRLGSGTVYAYIREARQRRSETATLQMTA